MLAVGEGESTDLLEKGWNCSAYGSNWGEMAICRRGRVGVCSVLLSVGRYVEEAQGDVVCLVVGCCPEG